MHISIPDHSAAAMSLRARLLMQGVRAHLEARGHEIGSPEARDFDMTCLRAALPPRPHVTRRASLGLGLPQALSHGPATALLTQSIPDELRALAPEAAWTKASAAPLVLQGYTRAILFDRAALIASLGFAPWVPLALSDRFPLLAPQPIRRKSETVPRVLVIDHGAPLGLMDTVMQTLGALEVALRPLTPDTGFAAIGAGLAADLHVHLGYDPTRPITGFAPSDSVLSGVYTLVLTDPALKPDPQLKELCTGRSYADIAGTLTGLTDRAQRMIARLCAICRTGEILNPELARFAAQNAAARATALGRFDAVFETQSPTKEAA